MDANGERVTAYEREFAGLVRAKRAIAFAYARHGLIGILSAAGLRAGDEVVLSPLTCKVIPLSLLSLNLKPVYADISAGTLNLDSQRLGAVIGPAARAVLFQHTYGSSVGVEAVAKVAELKKVVMIEDCAQCLPYAEDDQSPGNWSQAAIFSNNLLKPLPAGSGGIAVTKDSELARKIGELRNRLSSRRRLDDIVLCMEVWLHRFVLRPTLYWPLFRLNSKSDPIYKARPLDVEIADEITKKAHRVSEYQMCTGIRWLRKVKSIAAHRRRCCDEYTTMLSGVSHLDLPAAGTTQPLYYFPVLVKNKQRLMKAAQRKRIEIIAWPTRTPIYPVEHERDLDKYGYELGACPVAESIAAMLVGLPTHLKTTTAHRKRIVDLLRKVSN